MMKHSLKLVACLGFFGVAALAPDAKALSNEACEQLSGNMFLAAIERGECDVGIQTAAGPDELIPNEEPQRPHRPREGRNGDDGGDGEGGGGERGGDDGHAGAAGR